MKSELHLSQHDAIQPQPSPVGRESHPSVDVLRALVSMHVSMIGPIHRGTALDKLLRSFVSELRRHLPFDYSDVSNVTDGQEISE